MYKPSDFVSCASLKLVILGPLYLDMNFKFNMSKCKNSCWDLDWNFVDSRDYFEMDVSTVLSLLSPEHGLSLYLEH